MYVTPGPNNTILTTSGIKFGFFKTIPNLFGIPSGHGLQLCLVCLGFGALFVVPIILDVLRYVGATCLLYLSYKMLTLNIKNSTESAKPLRILRQLFFNLLTLKHGLFVQQLFHLSI